MADKRWKVTFEPEGKSVYVLDGTTIYEATGEAGIIIKAECGGIGVCGNCRVNVIKGKYKQKGSERFLTAKEIKEGTVLSCRTNIKGDMVVEIPLTSRLFDQKILTEGIEKELKLSPNVKKLYVKVNEPTLEDQRSDLDRIWDALKPQLSNPKIPVDVLRRVPDKLRKGDFSTTVVLNGEEIVGIETGNKTDKNYGVAFDIGTTTVVGYLRRTWRRYSSRCSPPRPRGLG